MGRLKKDAKNLILGKDNSINEPSDFKTELQDAIKSGLISKADGTLLITSRTNCDKLGEQILKTEEKDVIRAGKDDGIEFNNIEEALEYEKEKKEEKEEKDRKRIIETQEKSLEQQIQESQNASKAKMDAEKNLDKEKEIARNK